MRSIHDMEGIKMAGGGMWSICDQLIVPEQWQVIHYGVLEVWSEAYM